MKVIKGISVGRCICPLYDPKDIGKTDFAHAHSPEEGYRGWICVESRAVLRNKAIMLHELAHIIANAGHNDKWRRCVIRLGGTLGSVSFGKFIVPSYRKGADRKQWA